MKKLKKSLSLLLALVMVLSCMSVGVFADGSSVTFNNVVYDSLEAAVNVANGEQITLGEGTYTLNIAHNNQITKTINIKGAGKDKTVINAPTAENCYGGFTNIVLEDLTIACDNYNYHNWAYVANATYKNCKITGLFTNYAPTVKFEMCEFVQTTDDQYSIWTYAGTNVTFDTCTFTASKNSKSVLCYTEQDLGSVAKIQFTNCSFSCNKEVEKSAVMINPTAYDNVNTYVVSFTNCNATGYGTNQIEDVDGLVGLKKTVKDNITITIDDTQVYPEVAAPAVATIGTTEYPTLAAAVAAVNAGETKTIKLLSDASGAGIFVEANGNRNITVDFNGYTYTCTGPAVGSTGTESQAWHLEEGNTITLKNGTVTTSTLEDYYTSGNVHGVLMIIQNYCDLTLDHMTVDGQHMYYNGTYALSNNNGTVKIKDTTITRSRYGNGPIAFDVCRYSSYPSVNVTVEGNSVINGNIEFDVGSANPKDGAHLFITSGTINGQIKPTEKGATALAADNSKASISITGGTFSSDPSAYVAAGYLAVETVPNTTWVVKHATTTSSTPESTDKGSSVVVNTATATEAAATATEYSVTVTANQQDPTTISLIDSAEASVSNIATSSLASVVKSLVEQVESQNTTLSNDGYFQIELKKNDNADIASDSTATDEVITAIGAADVVFDVYPELVAYDADDNVVASAKVNNDQLASGASFTFSLDLGVEYASKIVTLTHYHYDETSGTWTTTVLGDFATDSTGKVSGITMSEFSYIAANAGASVDSTEYGYIDEAQMNLYSYLDFHVKIQLTQAGVAAVGNGLLLSVIYDSDPDQNETYTLSDLTGTDGLYDIAVQVRPRHLYKDVAFQLMSADRNTVYQMWSPESGEGTTASISPDYYLDTVQGYDAVISALHSYADAAIDVWGDGVTY